MKEKINKALAQAVIRILKPIIRVLMRNEISHGEFAEYAKQAYIDVAYEHFSIPNRKTTYSRVAILTGLNRKEVVRLNQQDTTDIQPRKGTTNRAMRVVSGWLQDPDFQDEKGKPLTLPVRDDDTSFNTLALRYSGDITARAVLDELIRVGIVKFSSTKQTVQLLSDGYIPQHGEPEKIDILSTCASDLLETAVHNLESDDVYFQRQLIHRDVPESLTEEFRRYSQKKSTALLNDLNQWISKRVEGKIDDTDSSVKRIGIGIYYFQDSNQNKGKKNEQ